MATDTIAAIATATGAAGVGIVRVSGPAAIAIGAAVVGRDPSWLRDRMLRRAVVRDRDGGRLDDGLVVAMRGPTTFTGEDVVELQVHGGAVNLGRVLAAVVAADRIWPRQAAKIPTSFLKRLIRFLSIFERI